MEANQHYYLKFDEGPRSGYITEISFRLVGFYLHGIQTRAKWKKENRKWSVGWPDNNGVKQDSTPINYKDISRFIGENGYFNNAPFNLPTIECFWLDRSIDYKINWHKFDHTAPGGLAVVDGTPKQQYGKDYPIEPRLIREGHSYTTLQPQLMERIVRMRSLLVDQSDKVLTDEWFFDLRSLISDTVSLVEITLNQFYIKAQYDPSKDWTFDKAEVGEKHGRRFEDKLKWIHKITGRNLNAEEFLPKFHVLRALRNHLMHFDPPSLVITVEESCLWLNYVIDTGWLLIKMREAMGVEVSLQLLNFVLQKEAIFTPQAHSVKRLPIGTGGADYASTVWRNPSAE